MKWWHALFAPRADLLAEDLRLAVEGVGAQQIGSLPTRARARIAGQVISLTFQPKGATPALVARVNDGTGTIGLVFLGRTEVPGIEAGRRLVATGTVADDNGLPVIFNPSYELLPR
jgi:hypothetical protein